MVIFLGMVDEIEGVIAVEDRGDRLFESREEDATATVDTYPCIPSVGRVSGGRESC
jgi:hypothetical protein